MKKLIILSGIAFLIYSSVCSQSSCDYKFVNGTKLLERKLQKVDFQDQPGYALLVGKSDRILFQHTRGLKNLKTKDKITLDTPFYVASVGKIFTSWAILKLIEDKKLRFDKKLNSFFPEFPAFAESITVYHLLNHTSGLPDFYETFGEDISMDNPKVLGFVKQQDTLLFKPGYDYGYSNTGYVLLAEIIQKVTGKKYSEYLKEQFFEPLNMNNTYIIDNPEIMVPNKAVGYIKINEGWSQSDYENIYTTGAGAIYTTVGDLYKWFVAISKNQFLKQGTSAIAFNAPYTISGKKSYMMMGWFDETFGKRTPQVEGLAVSGAIGVLKGFRSNLHVFQDHDFVFILLSNNGDFPIRSHEIAEVYFTRKIYHEN